MIAQSLACNPAVLIADEPTTALDVTIQAQILELMQELQRSEQMSIILITHDLAVVARMADKVAVMYAGQVVESGKVDEIFYRSSHPYTLGLRAAINNDDQGRLSNQYQGAHPISSGHPLDVVISLDVQMPRNCVRPIFHRHSLSTSIISLCVGYSTKWRLMSTTFINRIWRGSKVLVKTDSLKKHFYLGMAKLCTQSMEFPSTLLKTKFLD